MTELPNNCIFLLNQETPIDELLGSVTTYNNVEGSDSKNMQIRTSARVFKKMKLDLTPTPAVPSPVTEKKETIKEEVKQEAKKSFRPLWEPEDKNLFFEALNEYGKDFEAIHSHISSKLKKKGVPESHIKTKEQIRHWYYRTWHKISKHLKFSDEVKKVAQELYGLINYGELRKKLALVSEKSCVKLNELIYRGFVGVRVKGKTIRIRTPMCRALRSLNQLDERNNDLKLPLKITVELKPKDMNTWTRVQQLSQNPRVKTILPLQKRLSSLLICMSDKWKTQEMLQYEATLKQLEQISDSKPESAEDTKPSTNTLLRLCPPVNCNLDVPVLNLTEYLTSQNICLSAYEERLGVTVRGEHLWLRSLSSSSKANIKKTGTKRMRHESNSEKVSPTIYNKNVPNSVERNETELNENFSQSATNQTSVSDVIDEAVNTLLALQNQYLQAEEKVEKIENTEIKVEEETKCESTQKYENVILKHKNGWTLENCGTLCIGDLYLMCGSDSKLTLEYSWDEIEIKNETKPFLTATEETADPENCDRKISSSEQSQTTSNPLAETLTRLLSVAKLHYRKNRVECPCGHVCGGAKSSAPRMRNITKNIQIPVSRDKFYNNTDKPQAIDPGKETSETTIVHGDHTIRRLSPSVLFRRPSSPNDLLRAQLDSIQRLRPRYCNRKGRRPRAKPVAVDRKLPILPNAAENGRQIVQMSIISQDNITSLPIASELNLELANNVINISDNVLEITSEVDVQQANIDDARLNANYIDDTFSIMPMDTIDGTIVSSNSNIIICDNATTPSRVGSPTDISNLIEMALTSNGNNDVPIINKEKTAITSFVGLLPQASGTPPSSPCSPSRVLKENENQWLNAEVADFSFSSFLGHLESPLKGAPSIVSEDSRLCLSQEVQCLLTENSLDYAAKFADLAAQVTDSGK